MNILRHIISPLILCAFCVNAQSPSSPNGKNIIILNGYFLTDLPFDIKNSDAPQDLKIVMLSTPNGTKAIGMSTATELPDGALKYAIPIEQVTEGQELLRCFNEAMEHSQNIPLSMDKQSH